MPGHIWLLLGDWEMTAIVNERAATVDHQYFQATGTAGGTYTPYYIHNLHFIVYAREMQGRRADTLRAANELAKEMRPMADAMPAMADSFMTIPLLAAVRFGDWNKVLGMPEPREEMTVTRATWHLRAPWRWRREAMHKGRTRSSKHLKNGARKCRRTAAGARVRHGMYLLWLRISRQRGWRDWEPKQWNIGNRPWQCRIDSSTTSHRPGSIPCASR